MFHIMLRYRHLLKGQLPMFPEATEALNETCVFLREKLKNEIGVTVGVFYKVNFETVNL